MLTENQVFQFFVRATDSGAPPLHTDVPVQVYIMSANDISPLFQRSDHKFFLPENAPPGKICMIQKCKRFGENIAHYDF